MPLDLYLCNGKLENMAPYRGIFISPRDEVERKITISEDEVKALAVLDVCDLYDVLFRRFGIRDEERDEERGRVAYMIEERAIENIKIHLSKYLPNSEA